MIYVGERGGKFAELLNSHKAIDYQYSIFAGKLRRYHGESWVRRVFDIKSNLLNVRDAFKLIIGIFQAIILIARVKPDLVFQKGGYVGVPVGIASALLRIPIVTHDSDAMPGLANRLISRWAKVHATALPAKYYNYPAAKVVRVGVLVERNYQPVDKLAQNAFKQKLSIDSKNQLLLITGGSSGAVLLNKAVANIVNELLSKHESLNIIHQAGKGKTGAFQGYTHPRLKILEFMIPMHEFTGAADLIVTRAGANAVAEFGVQGKACIVVPSAFLSGGHQLKNAEILVKQDAAMVVYENDMDDKVKGLLAAIERLLEDASFRDKLAKKLQSTTITDAANRLATLLIDQASHNKDKN